MPNLSEDMRTRYLLSFLMILVHRAGGSLIIDNLSEYRGRGIVLNMQLEPGADRVVLQTIEPEARAGGPSLN